MSNRDTGFFRGADTSTTSTTSTTRRRHRRWAELSILRWTRVSLVLRLILRCPWAVTAVSLSDSSPSPGSLKSHVSAQPISKFQKTFPASPLSGNHSLSLLSVAPRLNQRRSGGASRAQAIVNRQIECLWCLDSPTLDASLRHCVTLQWPSKNRALGKWTSQARFDMRSVSAMAPTCSALCCLRDPG